jgi:hypothetical protein
MKKSILACLLLPGLFFAQSPSPEPSKPLLLTHVTVIDSTGGPAKPGMSVYIRDHRIVPSGRRASSPRPTKPPLWTPQENT